MKTDEETLDRHLFSKFPNQINKPKLSHKHFLSEGNKSKRKNLPFHKEHDLFIGISARKRGNQAMKAELSEAITSE